MVTKALSLSLSLCFYSWVLYSSLGPCPLSERKPCQTPTLWEKSDSLLAGSSFFYWGHLNWSQADLERERLGFSPGELTSIMIEELGNAPGRENASPHSRGRTLLSHTHPVQGPRAGARHFSCKSKNRSCYQLPLHFAQSIFGELIEFPFNMLHPRFRLADSSAIGGTVPCMNWLPDPLQSTPS